MGIPEEIRKVERPKNTVVCDTGSMGPNKYCVRERNGAVCIKGCNPQPRNGRVIGHIYEGKFVPIDDKDEPESDVLSYATSELVRSVSADLMDELTEVFQPKDACTIMSIAALRVIKPGITNGRLSTHYNRTFVNRFYPGASISKNSVKDLFDFIGGQSKLRSKYFDIRMGSVMENEHIVIDGMLKTDNSEVNDLSEFSYKARIKGVKDISILYAYNLEKMEPICCEVFPGNSTDAMSYRDFIRNNNITEGIIVADKGFPPSAIKEELASNEKLHYLTPLKRNDLRIAKNDMLEYDSVINGEFNIIKCKKKELEDGHFLYSFQDVYKSATEENDYLRKHNSKGRIDVERYSKKDGKFGTIVFISDADLELDVAYKCYEERWKIELVFKALKHELNLDHTNVQGDLTVMGSEFVNFVSTVIMCRIIRRMVSSGLLKTMTYGEIMEDLSMAWRRTDAAGIPSRNDGKWVHTPKQVFDIMEQLDLIPRTRTYGPKKRGRPKKEVTGPVIKRPRGRPRKNPLPVDL